MKRYLLCSIFALLSFGTVIAHETTEKSTTRIQKDDSKTDPKTDQVMGFILKKAEQYSDKAEEALAKGVDFAMKEIPLVVEEFLKWRAWEHGIRFAIATCFWLPLLILAASLAWHSFFRSKDENAIVGCLMAALACGVIGSAVFFANVSDAFNLVKIKVAPRVYLIEESAKLIKH